MRQLWAPRPRVGALPALRVAMKRRARIARRLSTAAIVASLFLRIVVIPLLCAVALGLQLAAIMGKHGQ